MADRKFAVWKWSQKGGPEVVELEVRVKWGGRDFDLDLISGKGNGPTFYISHPDPLFEMEGTDLQHLADLASEELEQKLVVSLLDNDLKAEPTICIVYRTVEYGVTHNGDAILRWPQSHSSYGHRYERKPLDELDLAGTKNYDLVPGHDYKFLGMVDDTPENRAALEALQEQIRSMREQLKAFMAGDKLQKALSNINLKNLLPQAS